MKRTGRSRFGLRARLAILTVAIFVVPTFFQDFWLRLTLRILALVGVLLVLEWMIVRPLQQLVVAARRLQNGERHIKVDINEHGEIGELGDAINDLARTMVGTEEQLRRLALQDPLTNLANRASVMQRLVAAQARHKRSGTLYGLLYIDLDAFKPVNDVYGHAIGDMVLQELAIRMERCVRGHDTAARLGGDEFVIVLEDLGEDYNTARDQAIAAARRMHGALSTPVDITGIPIAVGASIGVVVPRDGPDPDVLLDVGDHAMYRAKHSDKSFVVAD